MPKEKVYIIAEIGINHDGKLNKVLSLIRLAKKAGASAVKFQMFKPESMSRKESVTKYKIFKNKPKLTLFEMWNKLKVKKEWLKKIKILCRKEKIDFGFSIFDEYSLNIVKSLKPNFLKIASSDINDIYLIKKIIETKIRLILSTGVSNLNEIKNVSKILKGYNFSLLHCVSLYPTEYKRVNLRRMIKLKKINSNIGFSDHTKGPIASIKAIEMGAKIIEKHFTLDKSSDGPDHICSADFKDLNLICEYSKFNSVVLGNDKIEPSYEENKIKKIIRKSIWASRDIKKYERFTIDNIEKTRPGIGMDIKNFEKILGRKSQKSYKKGNLIFHKF